MLSSKISKRFGYRILLSFGTSCCLTLGLLSHLAAQQTWTNPPSTYTTLPPQTDPTVQPLPNGQPPFANPPQTNYQAPFSVQQKPATSQAIQSAAKEFVAEQLPTVQLPSAETPSTPEAAPAATDDGISPDAIADDLAKGAEQAKNTFIKAVFENDRDSQIALATKYLLPIATIVFVMFAANWLGNYLSETVSNFVARRVDVTLGRFAGTIAKVVVLMSALMGVLAFYSVQMTTLAAFIAALGFAVGMALQGTLGNFASGIALLVFRPFNVGDYIVLEGSEGTVQAIELFTTSIDTLDNRRIVLPNESVFGSRIENWSHNNTRRVDVTVGVAYAADMKQTRRVLLDAMSTVKGAIPTPSPEVYLNELNASSVDWSCRVWCRPTDYLAVKERVTEAAKDALDRNGIGIPFPQLDLHVVSPNLQQRAAA